MASSLGSEAEPEHSSAELVEEPTGPPITTSGVAFTEVRNNGLSLARVVAEVKMDRKLVLCAVSQNGEALRFAPDRWRRDQEVVFAAASQQVQAIRHAMPDFLGHREPMLEAVRRYPSALQFASEPLRGDVELVRTASEGTWWTFQYATLALRSDRDFMLQAVRSDGRLLRFASEALRGDERIVMAAVRSMVLPFNSPRMLCVETTRRPLQPSREAVPLCNLHIRVCGMTAALSWMRFAKIRRPSGMRHTGFTRTQRP